jgi:c-di-GMP-binding flagellar brake protein YcgR
MEEKGKKPRVGIVNLERRRHPRFTVNLPIEYFQIDSSTPYTGRLIDASEGGLLVYLPERVEVGQHLKMKMFFSFGSDLNIIEIQAEVVWEDIHLGKDWGDYRFGVRFIDISQDDLNRLKDFLRNLSA